MKTLYLVRHAKSSWDHPGVADHDRTLSPRGERDAPRMGRLLHRAGVHPDLILTSTAARARATAEAFARALGISGERIVAAREIYHANEDALLALIAGIDDAISCALLVGHNPTISIAASRFARQPISMSTCAVVGIEAPCDRWAQFATALDTRLLRYEKPGKGD